MFTHEPFQHRVCSLFSSLKDNMQEMHFGNWLWECYETLLATLGSWFPFHGSSDVQWARIDNFQKVVNSVSIFFAAQMKLGVLYTMLDALNNL